MFSEGTLWKCQKITMNPEDCEGTAVFLKGWQIHEYYIKELL